jgi:hypothetical protein
VKYDISCSSSFKEKYKERDLLGDQEIQKIEIKRRNCQIDRQPSFGDGVTRRRFFLKNS